MLLGAFHPRNTATAMLADHWLQPGAQNFPSRRTAATPHVARGRRISAGSGQRDKMPASSGQACDAQTNRTAWRSQQTSSRDNNAMPDAPWSTCAITDMLRICLALSMMARSCGIVKFTCKPGASTSSAWRLARLLEDRPRAGGAHAFAYHLADSTRRGYVWPIARDGS